MDVPPPQNKPEEKAIDEEFARAAPRATNIAEHGMRWPNNAPVTPPPRRSAGTRKRVLRWIGIGLIYFVIFGVGSVAISYGYLVSQLPSAAELKARQFDFQTTSILDSAGNTLWEISPPEFGERHYVPLDAISPAVISATIATEDRYFYQNIGIDPLGILRAIYFNVTTGSIVAGGSTITQQLVRNVFFSPEERTARSIRRKIKEAVLATETTRFYGKDDILEIYLNQIYYGNHAYGIEAASRVYFNKHAADLTLAEAALLAGLPQQPAVLDPFLHPDAAQVRRENVLRLMVEAGYLSAETANRAAQVPVASLLTPRQESIPSPHFVMYVREILENTFPDGGLFTKGLQVQTTLDPRIQTIAEQALSAHLRELASQNVSDGAVVVLDVRSGAVLAMVGSGSFDAPNGGQINMAVQPRQPGSTFKPLVYLSAFEQGWTPGTSIVDEPVSYPDGNGGQYVPTNADGKFYGAVTVRTALANSLNIPAVKALDFAGIENTKALAREMGITTLTDETYGLPLALGSAEVPLLQMSAVYQALANDGIQARPFVIRLATDATGAALVDNRLTETKQVVASEYAHWLTDILSDNDARHLTMAVGNPLELPFPAAVKTGTTNDFRDAWTIGYTSDYVVGVWLGNPDLSPMDNVWGLTGAAPIWREIMLALYADGTASRLGMN